MQLHWVFMSIFKWLPVILGFTFLNSVEAGSVFSVMDSSHTVVLENGDHWIATDKAVHMVGSLIATVGSGVVLQRTRQYSGRNSGYVGLSFSLSLGLGKELFDSRQPCNHFSFKDMAANLVGSILGYLLLIQD